MAQRHWLVPVKEEVRIRSSVLLSLVPRSTTPHPVDRLISDLVSLLQVHDMKIGA